MPFAVSKSGGSYLVKKKGGGRSFGRHKSKAKAFAQIKAIEVSERRRKRRGK
jgi:hypothetical protein